MAKLMSKFKLLVLLFGFFSKVICGPDIQDRVELKRKNYFSDRDIAINKCIQDYDSQIVYGPVHGQNDSSNTIRLYELPRKSRFPTGYVHESPDDGFTEFPDPDHIRERDGAMYRLEKLAKNKNYRPRPKIDCSMCPMSTVVPSTASTPAVPATPASSDAGVSPVTLYRSWSTLSRLLFIICFTIFGVVFNGIFVSGFFVERTVVKIYNVFMCCLGFTDFITISIVLMTMFVVFISKSEEMPACHFIHFLVTAANYAYMLFYLAAAAEKLTRVRQAQNAASRAFSSKLPVVTISICITIISFLVAAIECIEDLNFDYCQRQHKGNIRYRISVMIIFYGLPFILTLSLLMMCVYQMNLRGRDPNFRRSTLYELYYREIVLNITMYSAFIFAWLPYITIIYDDLKVSDLIFYTCAWIGFLRSVLSGLVSMLFYKPYRLGFERIVNYVCCKISLNSRPHPMLPERDVGYEVRVNMLQNFIENFNDYPVLGDNGPYA